MVIVMLLLIVPSVIGLDKYHFNQDVFKEKEGGVNEAGSLL